MIHMETSVDCWLGLTVVSIRAWNCATCYRGRHYTQHIIGREGDFVFECRWYDTLTLQCKIWATDLEFVHQIQLMLLEFRFRGLVQDLGQLVSNAKSGEFQEIVARRFC